MNVADKMEAELNEVLAEYYEPVVEVRKTKGDMFINVFNKYTMCLLMAELEAVKNVVEIYKKKYDCVFNVCIGIFTIYRGTCYHQIPSIAITIRAKNLKQ